MDREAILSKQTLCVNYSLYSRNITHPKIRGQLSPFIIDLMPLHGYKTTNVLIYIVYVYIFFLEFDFESYDYKTIFFYTYISHF